MKNCSNLSTKALRALTTMALTLPGIQCAKGEAAITKPQTDFRFTRVDEGRDHYQIDIYAAQLLIPLAHRMDLKITANQDVMSGASTYNYEPQLFRVPGTSAGLLVSNRSGQSIQDKRSAGRATVRYFGDEYHVGVGAGVSEENFYESQTLHIDLTNEFNKTNTELSWGYSVSNDSIKPTLSSYSAYLPYQRPERRQGKLTQRFTLDMKQDLSKTTVAQAGIEFIADKGYLNDPYKLFFVYGDPGRSGFNGKGQTTQAPGLPFNPFPVTCTFVLEQRPDYRGTLATSLKLIQHITPLNSSVHFGYRFAQNTWNVKSNTLTLDYYQDFGDSLQVIPSLRYYTQGEAYFYAMAFDAIGGAPFPAKRIGSTGPASSDYRLGKFGSFTAEIKAHYKFLADQSGKFTIAGGFIDRKNKFHWGHKPYPINPDNDFKSYYGSIGLGFVF